MMRLAHLAAPRAGLTTLRLDELLEALEIAFDARLRAAERVADVLDEAFRVVLHLQHDAALLGREVVERHHPGVRRAGGRVPRDAVIRDLLRDLGLPYLFLAA